MITAIKIDIENEQLLGEYANLLEAFAQKNRTTQQNITTTIEKVISQTLFRGITIKSGAGQGNPDFRITNDNMNSLLNRLAKEGNEMDNFNSYVSEAYSSKGNTVEAKIMRTQSDKDIKLGGFVPKENQDALQYFDFTSGNIIDTTRFSVVRSLRQQFMEVGLDKPVLGKPLTPEVKKAEVSNIIKNASPEFSAIFKSDKNVKALMTELDKKDPTTINQDKIKSLLDDINDVWATKTLEKELNRISRTGNLFDLIKKVPALDSQFYSKSRIISILRSDNNKTSALVLYFPYSHFTNKYFGAKYEEGTIKVFIRSEVEKMFHEQLASGTAALTLKNSLEEYDEAVKQLAISGSFKKVLSSTFNEEIKYILPTGGSIPMSKGNFFNVKRKYKRPPFFRSETASGQENIGKYTNENKFLLNTFLSSEFLSLLVRRKITQTMPHGPVYGRITDPDMLTYRTGRFANSIELLVNYRNRVVQYYYNPIYYVHERTSRNPKNLIESSINEVMRERFRQAFNIQEIKGPR